MGNPGTGGGLRAAAVVFCQTNKVVPGLNRELAPCAANRANAFA